MTDEAALRQIFERLGGIDAKLEAGGLRHAEFSHTLADLDGKVDRLTERVGSVEALAARVPIIEPTVWDLEGRRLEAQGVRKLLVGAIKLRHAIWLAIGGAAAAFGVHFTGFPPK